MRANESKHLIKVVRGNMKVLENNFAARCRSCGLSESDIEKFNLLIDRLERLEECVADVKQGIYEGKATVDEITEVIQTYDY